MAGLANPFIGTVITKYDGSISHICDMLIAFSVVSIFTLVFCVYLVERLCRRTLLLTFSPLCIGSLLIMGGVLRTSGPAVGPVLIVFA